MIKNRLAWMIGGAQGSGVDSSATIFGRACALGGLYTYGNREYYSNIMGEHSYFMVRVDERPIHSHLWRVDLLATFDAETIVRHALDVKPEGAIIYNPEFERVRLTDIPTLEKRLLADLRAHLDAAKKEQSVLGMLEDAEARGVRLYPIPYTDLLKEVAEALGETRLSRISRAVNTMAVASSFGLLEFDLEALHEAIGRTFKGKGRVIEMNIKAGDLAYSYAKEHFAKDFPIKLERLRAYGEGKDGRGRIFIQGNQAIALGKLVGGCRFQTYYPISPATDESVYLEANEVLSIKPSLALENPQLEEAQALKGGGGGDGPNGSEGSIIVMQTEDEIASITMATGAALTGVRAATSTSGPGFSLMMEGLGWAGMNEVPLVITYYQRCGPSTGMPTRQEQGDLRFALHAGHGEFPRIVLASGDQRECFYDAVRCFNYAERYQMPVIHLVDKALANTAITVEYFDLSPLRIERGEVLGEEGLERLSIEGGRYRRFLLTDSGVSPRALLGSKGGIFWNTGNEHDEEGYRSEDPVVRMRMMEKRMRKLELADREIPLEERFNLFGPEDAELTVVSWGSPKGAILDAMEQLAYEGHTVNFLQVRLIQPLAEEYVQEVLGRAKRKLNIEMNYSSQLAGWIRERTGVVMDHYAVKYNGRPISMEEAYQVMKEVLKGTAPKNMVLTHGG